MIPGINGWEFVLLALIAVFVLGPDKLPGYAAKLAQGIRKFRGMAEGAKGQLKDQLGPEYSDINWRQYDPRQYDPRRIIRDALLDSTIGAGAAMPCASAARPSSKATAISSAATTATSA